MHVIDRALTYIAGIITGIAGTIGAISTLNIYLNAKTKTKANTNEDKEAN